MNQQFDTTRTRMLIGKHWAENRKKYTLSIIAIAGLLLVWMFFMMMENDRHWLDEGMQSGTYYFGLGFLGCLYASLIFSDLDSKSRGMNFLSVPASVFEKLLTGLLFTVFLFFIVYTGVFYLVDIAMVNLSNALAANYWAHHPQTGEVFRTYPVVNIFDLPGRQNGEPNLFIYALLAYLAVQSAFALGSVYFSKFSFLKTFISLLLLGLFFVFLVGKILHPALSGGEYYHGLTSYIFYSDNNYVNGNVVSLPEWINRLLIYFISYAFAPLFWLVTYFRLKEKEV